MRKQKIFSIGVALLFLIFIPIMNLYFDSWTLYSRFYVYLAVIFVWYSLILLFTVEIWTPKDYGIEDLFYSVLCPIYNEDPKTLEKTIDSLHNCYGKKEIIMIDDGSERKDTKQTIKALVKKYPETRSYFLPMNLGKKFAQIKGLIYAKSEYCITVDSDTIFERDAPLRLVTPLLNKKIGLTNTNVEILNKDENRITKLQELQNYGAFNMGRKSLGGLGIMNCASGIGIGFRRSDLLSTSLRYLGKRPFGFDCKFGEDRFMTNIMLRSGYEVIFVEKAKAYTVVPNTLKKFMLQQLRWRVSGIIEGIHVLTFSWRRSIILFTYSIFNLLLPFMCISVIITIIISNLLARDFFNILTFVLVIITATFVRDTVIIFNRNDLIKQVIPYSFLNLFGLIWLWIIACFRIDEQTWITR